MGMRFSGLLFFFIAQGASVGLVGIALGVVLGYGATSLLSQLQPVLLSESIYNVTRLPVRIELTDVALVSGVGFLLCILFSIVPAVGAAVSRPVSALRYE